MPKLDRAELTALVDAAIACDLARGDRRDLLFTGLSRSTLASVPIHPRPKDQVEADLLALAALEADGETPGVRPLVVWLDNAARKAARRPEAAVFERVRRAVEAREAAVSGSFEMGEPIPATDERFAHRLDQRPILWVGAGLSIPAGYPSAGALADTLRAAAEPGEIPRGLDDIAAVADRFMKVEGKGALHRILAREFARADGPTAVHAAIARLAAAGTFEAIITTNYDTLIEDALRRERVPFVPSILDGNTHVRAEPGTLRVAKIHGDVGNWKDAILSGASYATFADRYGFLMTQLDLWMTQHPFIFVGCSMKDPRILKWLRDLPPERAELIQQWRPMMIRDDWDAAWAAAPDALSVGNIRPLIVDDYTEHLPALWSDAARRRAPRLDWLDLELTVEADGWSARLGSHRWRVDDPIAGALAHPDTRAFTRQVRQLLRDGNRPLPTDPYGAPLPTHAGIAAGIRKLSRSVGDRLTAALLPEAPRAHVAAAIAAGTGQAPPCLRIRVTPATPADTKRADHALALPWELLRIDDVFPVEAGTLDLAREAVVEKAEGPGAPDQPLTVVATVAAPSDASRLDYEDECYRLWTALGDADRRLLLTDRGTVDDFVDAVVALRPTAVHFTGHGGPGALLFEDEAARRHPVAIDEVVRRLRRGGDEALPRLMFIAACHGASVGGRAGASAGTKDEARDEAGDARADDPKMTDPAPVRDDASVAAALNRAGFADVIGYFGPVGDAQSTRIEAAFYAALVGGASARAAVRRGRAIAAKPHGRAGGYTHVYPLGWAQLALYHRGADQPVATTREARAVDIHRRGLRRRGRRLDRAGMTPDGVERLHHGFIGRRTPRATVIGNWLDGQRLQVVHGLGGLGKTALCAEVAPILARRMGGVPLLALDGTAARGRERPIEALWAELSLFDPGRAWDRDGWESALAGFQEGGLTGAGLARGVLDAARRCGGLLVYLDDTESLLADSGDVRRWVDDEARVFWETLAAACAPAGRFGVLASSRYVPRHTPGAALVPLPPMRVADVVRLLRWMPTLGRVPFEHAEWLAGRIDGHPRTVQWLDALVAQRAAAVARRSGPYAEYDGRDWRGEVLEPALAGVGEKVDADLLLPRLYDALPAGTRAHLGACCVLSRPVPWGAVAALGDAEAATALVDMGLLSPDVLAEAGETWWAPHGLVRAAIGPRWGGDAARAHRVVGRWLAGAFEERSAGALLLPAIEHLLAAGEADAAWPLARLLVLALRRAGRYREALAQVEAVLRAGPSGEALGMGLTYRVQLGWQANAKLDDPVGDLERASGLVAPGDLGFTLATLAQWHQARGRLSSARGALERAVDVLAQLQPPKHGELAAALHELAGVLRAQGDLGGARSRLERSLEISAAVFGTEEHPDVAASLHALAGVLRAQGDLGGARSRLERSLEIKAAVFGTEEHPDVAASLHALAGVMEAQGDLGGARSRLERSLEILAAVFGTEEHPSVAASLHALAVVLWQAGDRARAISTLEHVIGIRFRMYGTRDHYLTAENEWALGQMLAAVGRTQEALALLTHAGAVFRAALGPAHPSTQAVARLIAQLGGGGAGDGSGAPTVRSAMAKLQAGDAAGAIADLEARVPAAVEAGDVADEASARGLLGQLYAASGRAEDARPHLERARAIAEQVGQADAAAHFRALLDGLGRSQR